LIVDVVEVARFDPEPLKLPATMVLFRVRGFAAYLGNTATRAARVVIVVGVIIGYRNVG